MTAREDAIEAIARALHSDNCPDDVDDGEPCDCGGWDREAEVAYEAAEPIIRADGECVEVECPHLLEAAALAAQVSNLTRWKIEATTVIKAWEQVHGLLGSPGQIGESKASATYDRVVALLGGESE